MRTMILKLLLSVIFALVAVLPALSEPLTLLPGADYAGGDYRTVKNTDLLKCQALCEAERKCQAFTFNTKANWCFLKSDTDILMPFATAVGGSKLQETTSVAKSLQPQPKFIDSYIVNTAQPFATSLKTAAQPENKDVFAIRQDIQAKTAAQNFQGAADQLKALISLGNDSYEVWRDLAYAMNAIPNAEPSQVAALNQNSLSLAYTAYEHATNEQQKAESLALLSSALIRNGVTRPAIDALQLAARSYPSPILTAALNDAKLKYGFRVLDYKVEADASNPRACIQFSEQLKQGRVDFMPFVTVEGAAPAAVSANGQELCVEGIKRGERRAVTIREGLPSEIGENTLKPVTLSVFIRDRSPTVRFSGAKYVLPSSGRHGVPIVSINAAVIAVEVYHIPERGLAGFVKGSQFLSQLSSYDARNIGEDAGEKIWTGTLQTEPQSNEEVTTNLPLDEVIKNRQPGVYVITATPAGAKPNDYGEDYAATQWLLVSDLGVTTLSNESGLSVFVRSLNSAQAVANTEVELVARNNAVLGKAKTNELGLATFEGGVMRGQGGNAPAIVTVAGANNDFGFIDLNRGAYDLSDRGVGGREAPGPIDIFMYPERDIYRPGHTVHLTAIARDDKAVAITGLPLTLIVSRPDGVEYQRYQVSDQGQGGYSLDIPLKSTAMRGMWTVAAHIDPKQDAIATQKFRVDDFIPDRIEFKLTSDAKAVSLSGLTEAKIDARFLYGAPASDLKIEGDITLAPKRNLDGFDGYYFGLEEKSPTSGRTELTELGTTDADGKATVSFQPTDIPQTTQPLEATLNIRVVEGSGRAIERQLIMPAEISTSMIGIKPAATNADSDQAQFDVISIDANKTRTNSGPLSWELLRVNDNFQWYQKDGRWQYEATQYTNTLTKGHTTAGLDAPAHIEAKLDWGHYRLLVESDDPKGPAASYDFYAGGYYPQISADTPDILQISLDKKKYKIGETATIKIEPRFAGTALVNIVGQSLIETKAADIPSAGGEFTFTVTEAWTPGTYITATLFKPIGGDANMPGRAIGIMPIGKDEVDRTINVKLDPPKQIAPNGKLIVPVILEGIKAGEEAHLTLAAVDVGVLNVTGYQPPDAAEWFYGQRRLAMELRDIYGQLINGALGKAGQIRVGGGDEADAGAGIKGNPTSTEVVSLYSGIVKTDANGKTVVTFDVPQFNGTLRLMAVAWSNSAIGNTSTDVIVREPVVISEGMPKILAPGDQSRIRFDIDNTDGPEGDYQLAVTTSSGLALAENQASLELLHGKRVDRSFDMKALATGLQTIDVSLKHVSGLEIKRHLAIMVRVGEPAITERKVIKLAPGGSLDLSADMLANKIDGTGAVSVSITRSGALDVPGILQMLDRYPYGCSEQTTSRALPLIYFEDVAARAGLDGDKDIRARVQDAITRVLANESSNGSFGLWDSYSSNDLWLDSYVVDFLTRAKENKYDVPQQAFDLALNNLQNVVGYTQNIEEKPADIAYAMYVLARNKKASIGDLRFYAETKLESFPSPLAKAQLGAALAFYGDKARATSSLEAAYSALRKRTEEDWWRYDYGSNLRDAAALLALTVEADPSSPLIEKLTGAVTRFQAARRWTSTQEQAWMLLAAHALQTAADAPKISVGNKSFDGDYVQIFKRADLAKAIHISNTSNRPIEAVVSTTGVPDQPEPASANGFTIERNYFNFNGTKADLALVKQNDRIVVTLKVKQANLWPSKVMITDLLPSGLEIENPSLVSSAGTTALTWLPEITNNAYLEFRDDRFAAAMNREKDDTSEMNFAYVVRAVTPGSFILPPALVEDMYRPYLNAKTESGVLDVK